MKEINETPAYKTESFQVSHIAEGALNDPGRWSKVP